MIKKIIKWYLLRTGLKECKKYFVCTECPYSGVFACTISEMISKL